MSILNAIFIFCVCVATYITDSFSIQIISPYSSSIFALFSQSLSLKILFRRVLHVSFYIKARSWLDLKRHCQALCGMPHLHMPSNPRQTILKLLMESSMGRGALAYALCQAFSKAHPSSDVANYNVYRTIAYPTARVFCVLAFFVSLT